MRKEIITIGFLLGIVLISCKDNKQENGDAEVDYESSQELVTGEETNGKFEEFDKNMDEKWDNEEFKNFFESNFSEFDTDNDGNLDANEFYAINFRYVDKDNDKTVSPEEWNEGYNYLYGTYESDFDIFDADKDGILDTDEWNIGLADSEWFNDFDENDDGKISAEEWENGLFESWDDNQDGFIDNDEYTSQSVYFTSW